MQEGRQDLLHYFSTELREAVVSNADYFLSADEDL